MKQVYKRFLFAGLLLSLPAMAVNELDLPLCRDLPVSKGETLLGVTLPAQDKALEV